MPASTVPVLNTCRNTMQMHMGHHIPLPTCRPLVHSPLSEPKLLYFNRHIHFYSPNYTSMHAQCKYDVNSNLDAP